MHFSDDWRFEYVYKAMSSRQASKESIFRWPSKKSSWEKFMQIRIHLYGKQCSFIQKMLITDLLFLFVQA